MRKVKSSCRECGAVGIIFYEENVGDGSVSLIDNIRHKPKCTRFKKRRGAQPKHLRKKMWRPQERKAAKAIGGYETPLSGALNEDGDARQMKGWRAECKTTKSESYRVRQDVWSKLVVGALESGEEPALFVDLRGGNYSFVLVRTEMDPSQTTKSVKTDTPFGSVLPVDPPALVMSVREFESMRRSDEHERPDSQGYQENSEREG